MHSDVFDLYGDIIDLPHHTSSERQPMSINERAAQFAGFRTLSGLDDAIEAAILEEEQYYSNDNR